MNADTSDSLSQCRRAASQAWPGLALEVLPSIDSTNLELQRRWRAGQTQPQLLVAQAQTAGRGRLGRPWHSRAGASLTFSVGLPVPACDWSGLSLAVGVAVAQALDPSIGLKWPNDLWVMQPDGQGHKLGGILIETMGSAKVGGQPQPPTLLLIGVGLNIAPQALESVSVSVSVPPAFVQSFLPGITPLDALARIIPTVLPTVAQFIQTGFAPFQAAYAQRDVLANQAVVLSDGRTGIAAGVDADGALLVRGNGPEASLVQRVVSGEVSVRPAVASKCA